MTFLFGPFLAWFPIVMTAILFGLAVFLYVYRHKIVRFNFKKLINFTPLEIEARSGHSRSLTGFNSAIILAVSYRLVYALLNSVGQYYIWSQNEFTQLFLNSPVPNDVPGFITEWFPWLHETKLGYFLFYSWGRFWINVVIILLVAYAFWAFLKFLQKYKDRFFDIGEVQLGLLMSLIVGWPNFIIFIPSVFISMILISIFRGIFFKEPYTTLGWPFILGAAMVLAGDVLLYLFYGTQLISFLGLGNFSI